MEKLEHIQRILLFVFNRGAKAAEVARNIYAMFGDNVIRESIARKWFSRFKEDRFDISDSPCSGRSLEFHEDNSNTLIHNDPHECTLELADVMNCDHSTIMQNLHSMGKVQNVGVWVLHVVSQNHKNQRVAICASVLTHDRLACE